MGRFGRFAALTVLALVGVLLTGVTPARAQALFPAGNGGHPGSAQGAFR